MNLYVLMHMYAYRHQRATFHIVPHRSYIASTLVLFSIFHFFFRQLLSKIVFPDLGRLIGQ